jgi:hypothetical protein
VRNRGELDLAQVSGRHSGGKETSKKHPEAAQPPSRTSQHIGATKRRKGQKVKKSERSERSEGSETSERSEKSEGRERTERSEKGSQACAAAVVRIPSDQDVADRFGRVPGSEDVGSVGVAVLGVEAHEYRDRFSGLRAPR